MWKYIAALSVIFILSFSTDSCSQVKPDIVPEDFKYEEGAIVCFCKPGVRNKSRSKGLEISYGFLGQGSFEEEETPFGNSLSQYDRFDRFKVDVKIPILLKDHLAILVGYQFSGEKFNFNRIGEDFPDTFRQLDDDLLKSNNISLIISKPLSETRYIAGRLRYTSNGNYDQFFAFEDRYSIYKAIAIYGIKPHEDFEWGIGLSVSKGFRNNNIIPFLLYNKTFNNEWGIEAVLPGYVKLRCNLMQNLIVLAGVEFGSQSYRIDTKPNDFNEVFAYAYNHTELITSMSLDYGLSPWVWANLKIGYQFNFTSEFESRNTDAISFDADPSSALFFNIGVFISPPADEDEHDHRN